MLFCPATVFKEQLHPPTSTCAFIAVHGSIQQTHTTVDPLASDQVYCCREPNRNLTDGNQSSVSHHFQSDSISSAASSSSLNKLKRPLLLHVPTVTLSLHQTMTREAALLQLLDMSKVIMLQPFTSSH